MPPSNPHSGKPVKLADPIQNGYIIAPDDANDIAVTTRGIYVGVGGNIDVTLEGGTRVTFKNVPVCVLPVRATRVWAAGTSAAELLGLY